MILVHICSQRLLSYLGFQYFRMRLWCLTPLSTIFQLYRGGSNILAMSVPDKRLLQKDVVRPLEIFRCQESIRDIIIYPHMKCR
jgi:hypothetical protein